MTSRYGPGPRSGAIVAAVWLIGLGIVFLLQQTYGWSWGEAWPLFLILAGAGSLASVFATVRPRGRWVVALTWPVALIVVGGTFLASTTGSLGTEPGELVRWWPVALIVLGGWYLIVAFLPRAAAGSDQLSVPLEGAASADYGTAANKVELEVTGGVGSVRVSGVA